MRTLMILLASAAFILAGCKNEELGPISKGNGAPYPVVIEKVENLAGGARIHFQRPEVNDLMMIKAVYKLADGKSRTAVVSKYENAITVLGYNDEEEHQVILYSLNAGMQESSPTTVTIKPDKSPLKLVEESMEILSTFGGARFEWRNEHKVPLMFELFAADGEDKLQLTRVFSSSESQSYRALRGFDTEPRRFAAVVTDTSGNISDTIYPLDNTLIPLFEQKVDKKRMSVYMLNNDGDYNKFGMQASWIFDDDVTTYGHTEKLPNDFTIDLGSAYKLSRFRLWARLYQNSYYSWGNPRYFRVYGRLAQPSLSGDWDEWTLLETCEVKKPSGLSGTEQTAEDLAVAEEGHEFEMPFDVPSIRYIRFRVDDTWGGTLFAHPAELTLWGKEE